MDLLYYPGCTLKTSAKSLERTAFKVMESLGHRLVEMDEWNCCGVVASLTEDDLMHHLAPLRNLIHAQDQGYQKIVALCDMCCNTLKQTNLRVAQNEDDLDTLNSFMDKESDYRKSVSVQHVLEFLRDDVSFKVLKKKVKKPLKGLKLMPYYGCTMLRPRQVAIDDPEEPTILSDLSRALGAETVDNPYKIECCGSYHTIKNKEIVRKRAATITGYATQRGADAIILSCPLCQYNIDTRGKEAEGSIEGHIQIPVFYYPQLMAIAMGMDPSDCAFEKNAVDPARVLKERGIIK